MSVSARFPERRAASAPRLAITQDGAVRAAVVLLLVWYLGPTAPFLPAEAFVSEDAKHGVFVEQAFLRLSWIPVYGLTFILALPHLPKVIRAAARSPFGVLLVALALVSTAWSTSPADTLRRTVGLAGTTLLGFYLVARFEREELMRLLGWAFALAAVLSIVFVATRPGVGISGPPHPGAWRGVFPHKNVLGQTMLMGIVTALGLAAVSRRRRWAFVLAGLCGLLLLLSTAKTPIAVAAVLTMLVGVSQLLRRRPGRAGFLGALVVVLVLCAPFFVFVVLEPVLALLGRDLTLTGRTDIWGLSLAAVAEKPLIGWGYGGFWTAPLGPVLDIRFIIGWDVPNAHNGFLDLLLAFGVVGLLLFLMLVVRVIRANVQEIRDTGSWGATWSLASVTLLMIYGFAESAIMVQNTFAWVLLIALTAYAGKPRAVARGRAVTVPRFQWAARRPTSFGAAEARQATFPPRKPG
ncbi:O-antigen ligase family protein [Sabulicella rubraurantiaca]|uniref:O-antigen ligase family protein n=1 Tax=Sabulicella rubraurantiaca TaxID=2811429 RepID=UPI001A96F1D9|nr:O-antigen ligase [Sabulicella rubraurantiaca]